LGCRLAAASDSQPHCDCGDIRHDENLVLRFAKVAFRLGAGLLGAGRSAADLLGTGLGPLGAAAGLLFLAIFSLFRRFKFPVPQTSGNSAGKPFGWLGDSPSRRIRHVLKMLGNLKKLADISQFSGNCIATMSSRRIAAICGCSPSRPRCPLRPVDLLADRRHIEAFEIAARGRGHSLGRIA
jgi:hypothetical protein